MNTHPKSTEIFLTKTTDPFFNIALEEWLLKQYKSENNIIFLWQNFNSIIIGRNQNTHLEINQKLVDQYNIKVARRLSGGGAVFQDAFNQCWTFIIKEARAGDYRFFATPVLAFLKEIGVDAEFFGRNDLTVQGKKISGTSQIVYGDYVLCHGTILFDVDPVMMTSVLTPNLEKLSSKGIDSVRKRILNLKEVLPDWSFEQFQAAFFQFLEKYFNTQIKELPAEAIRFATEAAAKKFSTWEWNFGESREFEFIKKQYFANKGTITLSFNTNKNTIEQLKIHGDFLSTKELSFIELLLVGCRYDQKSVETLLEKIDLTPYLGGITKEDFIMCMFN
ncbi:lipoate-protein ligase A [Mycoplasmoides fastidiosum]|uniref:lipoate--protein ligase n=1 Tax=Mycoplasmoides fastidiosum TaxID=92758 RepID=A0ABU0LYW3_9BACT|nr:lipoate--protein ligase [Mycoplasmoides fastidiosum]MDQ0513897.1 lipoate-protein ligase A [Mycoplasmoides fastidiosum]UUD37689.1 lipoate--protein ligase [Mycoplasmoides fastidiosum]